MAALDFKKVLQKPLVARDDMSPEMSAECVELITAAVDKFLVVENYERAAQTCKESLDRKFGPTWNVCVGEGFGYDATYNAKHCLLVYYGAWHLRWRGPCARLPLFPLLFLTPPPIAHASPPSLHALQAKSWASSCSRPSASMAPPPAN